MIIKKALVAAVAVAATFVSGVTAAAEATQARRVDACASIDGLVQQKMADGGMVGQGGRDQGMSGPPQRADGLGAAYCAFIQHLCSISPWSSKFGAPAMQGGSCRSTCATRGVREDRSRSGRSKTKCAIEQCWSRDFCPSPANEASRRSST